MPDGPTAGPVVRAARVLTAMIGAAVMFSVAAPAASASGPVLTVVPADGLVPGAQVSFTATGLPPGVAVEVDECALPDLSSCIPVTASLLLTGPDGSVQGTATIVTEPVGCPPAPPRRCALGVVTAGARGWQAVAPIAFTPSVPPALPAAVPPVAPSTAPRPPTPAPPMPAPPSPAASPLRAGPTLASAHPLRAGASRPWAVGLVMVVVAAALAGAVRAAAARRRARTA